MRELGLLFRARDGLDRTREQRTLRPVVVLAGYSSRVGARSFISLCLVNMLPHTFFGSFVNIKPLIEQAPYCLLD